MHEVFYGPNNKRWARYSLCEVLHILVPVIVPSTMASVFQTSSFRFFNIEIMSQKWRQNCSAGWKSQHLFYLTSHNVWTLYCVQVLNLKFTVPISSTHNGIEDTPFRANLASMTQSIFRQI